MRTGFTIASFGAGVTELIGMILMKVVALQFVSWK